MIKKIVYAILIAGIIALIVPDHYANGKTQGADILLGKYICITYVDKNNQGFINCSDTFTAHKKIGSNYYLVRDYRDKKFLMRCNINKKKEFINCKFLNNK